MLSFNALLYMCCLLWSTCILIIPQELNYMIYYMKMWHDSLTWMIQINWYIYWTVKWELSFTRLESSSMITCDALCRYMNLVITSSYKHCIHFLSCSFFTIWIFVMYTYLCIFTCPSLGPNWSINILNLVCLLWSTCCMLLYLISLSAVVSHIISLN